MTTRDIEVIRVVSRLINRHVYTMPVDPFRIARAHGARMATLSDWVQRTGLREADVFEMWGNPDGVNISTNTFWSINYNERQPKTRLRFTVAEELMHAVLGHIADRRFNIAAQDYDEATYQLYETEAKHAAGMLLVPPTVYFRLNRLYSHAQIARLCDVSPACVYTVAQYYETEKDALDMFYTHKRLIYDASDLIPLNPLRPISVWAENGML